MYRTTTTLLVRYFDLYSVYVQYDWIVTYIKMYLFISDSVSGTLLTKICNFIPLPVGRIFFPKFLQTHESYNFNRHSDHHLRNLLDWGMRKMHIDVTKKCTTVTKMPQKCKDIYFFKTISAPPLQQGSVLTKKNRYVRSYIYISTNNVQIIKQMISILQRLNNEEI